MTGITEGQSFREGGQLEEACLHSAAGLQATAAQGDIQHKVGLPPRRAPDAQDPGPGLQPAPALRGALRHAPGVRQAAQVIQDLLHILLACKLKSLAMSQALCGIKRVLTPRGCPGHPGSAPHPPCLHTKQFNLQQCDDLVHYARVT